MYMGRIHARSDYQHWRATPVLFQSRAEARLITCQYPTVEDWQRNINPPSACLVGAGITVAEFQRLVFTKWMYQTGRMES